MLLQPLSVADFAPKVAPRTPRPTRSLMDELVKRAVQARRQQPGNPMVEPHEMNGRRLSRDRNGPRSGESLRQPSEHHEAARAEEERCTAELRELREAHPPVAG
jgi:hypothetical protein